MEKLGGLVAKDAPRALNLAAKFVILYVIAITAITAIHYDTWIIEEHKKHDTWPKEFSPDNPYSEVADDVYFEQKTYEARIGSGILMVFYFFTTSAFYMHCRRRKQPTP